MTTFGFAGMALIRPYLFGISTANQKERKAFLHFWAALNYLIGVKDRYNICLLPIKAAEIEFDIVMRNVLSPYLQLETVAFKRMVKHLIQGLGSYVKDNNYETQMFLVKRAVGIPGYQLDVNYTREVPYGNILSPADVAIVRRTLPRFSEKIQIYSIFRNDYGQANCDSYNAEKVDPFDVPTLANFDFVNMDVTKKLLGLPCSAVIRVQEVERGPSYLKHLNSRAFSSLSSKSQYNVNMMLAVTYLMKEPKGIVLANHIVDSRIQLMRKQAGYLNLNLHQIYPGEYVRGPFV